MLSIGKPRAKSALLFATALCLTGCDRDPNRASYTREKPDLKTLAGSYFPDEKTAALIRGHLDQRALTSRIILRPDHSAVIENIPEWTLSKTIGEVGEIVNRSGEWKLMEVENKYWVIDVAYAPEKKKEHDRIILHKQTSPHALHLRVGDPMTNQSLVFTKRF